MQRSDAQTRGPSPTLRRVARGGGVCLIVALACWSPTVLAQGAGEASSTEAAVVAPTDVETAAAEDGVRTGFFEIVFSGGIVGVALVIVLFALSALSLYLIVEQALFLRKATILPPGLADEAGQAILEGQVGLARQLCVDRPSVLAFVIARGLEEIDGGWSTIEKAIEDALAEQSARLYRKLDYLTAIGSIAPLIGLLGTVVGILFAFQRVALSRGSAGTGDLAEGIYQALVTTIGGLLIAIPALAAFAILRNRLDQLVAEAAYEALHVMRPLKRRLAGGGAVAAGTPTAAAPASPRPAAASGPHAPPPPPGR